MHCAATARVSRRSGYIPPCDCACFGPSTQHCATAPGRTRILPSIPPVSKHAALWGGWGRQSHTSGGRTYAEWPPLTGAWRSLARFAWDPRSCRERGRRAGVCYARTWRVPYSCVRLRAYIDSGGGGSWAAGVLVRKRGKPHGSQRRRWRRWRLPSAEENCVRPWKALGCSACIVSGSMPAVKGGRLCSALTGPAAQGLAWRPGVIGLGCSASESAASRRFRPSRRHSRDRTTAAICRHQVPLTHA